MTKLNITRLYPYLFISPFFLIFISFSLFPMMYSLVISFTKWNGINEMTFVGLDNYIRLFSKDPLFYKSIWNTTLVIIIAIPIQLFFGFMIAVLLKDFFSKFRGVFQLINFSPELTTPVAVGILFAILFDVRIGPINNILLSLGIIKNNIFWLNQVTSARFVMILLLVWQYFGYMMVMFLAGLSTVPDEIYDASKIDGAGWMQTLLRIRIPMMKNTFVFLLTTSVISGLQLFTEPQLLLTHAGQPLGGPGRSLLTSIMYIYHTAFQRFDFGYGAAMCYGLFIIIILVSLFSIKRITREGQL